MFEPFLALRRAALHVGDLAGQFCFGYTPHTPDRERRKRGLHDEIRSLKGDVARLLVFELPEGPETWSGGQEGWRYDVKLALDRLCSSVDEIAAAALNFPPIPQPDSGQQVSDSAFASNPLGSNPRQDAQQQARESYNQRVIEFLDLKEKLLRHCEKLWQLEQKAQPPIKQPPTPKPEESSVSQVEGHSVSPPTPPVNSVAGVLAAFDARDNADEFSDRGHQIGLRRRGLFIETLAQPVAAAVGPWTDGWRLFSDALRSGRTSDAVTRLQALSVALDELQSHWEAWERVRAQWYADEAEPWNAESARFNRVRFGPGWLDGDGEYHPWQRFLPWRDGGPKALPDRIVTCYLFGQAEHIDGDLFTDLRAIYLGLKEPGAASQLISRLGNPERVANVAIAVGATILSGPDLLALLADGIPSVEVLRDVQSLFRATPDEVYKPLRTELENRLGGRFSSTTRTAQVSTPATRAGKPSPTACVDPQELASTPPTSPSLLDQAKQFLADKEREIEAWQVASKLMPYFVLGPDGPLTRAKETPAAKSDDEEVPPPPSARTKNAEGAPGKKS